MIPGVDGERSSGFPDRAGPSCLVDESWRTSSTVGIPPAGCAVDASAVEPVMPRLTGTA